MENQSMEKKKTIPVRKIDGDTLVVEKEHIKEPKHYTVILHNDDFTTQDFVVHVLVIFFHKNQEEAYRLMLKVHLEGKARVGRYTKDIAESKISLIMTYSRQNGMPLLVTAEPE
jgi:ATP-dependent Clp protease adaptor protein ClpS